MLVLFLLTFSLIGYVTASPIWPQPSSINLGNGTVIISEDFLFIQTSSSGKKSDRLQRAFSRYESLFHQYKSKDIDQKRLSRCQVVVNQISDDEITEQKSLKLDVDESYQIEVTDSSCIIKSETIWGSIWALESFSQLLVFESKIQLNYLPVQITDSPRYSHRGILVDSSRHFLPMSSLEHTIDSLVLSKFNVLHWHMIDAQSFPYNSVSQPTMVKGAYTPDQTYTINQINEITSYATDRGVRIVFELDVPGHAYSWVNGQPAIMADCLQKYTNVNNYALNPSMDLTYQVIHDLISDIVAASNVDQIHVGGDEVVYGCWSNDQSITSFMSTNLISSYDQLLGYFANRLDKDIAKSNVTPIHWEEVFTATSKSNTLLPKSVIYEVWTNASSVSAITAAGYRTIVSTSSYWYLDNANNTWQVFRII